MLRLAATASVMIRATPEAVFDAFVDAETMSRFWFTRRDHGLSEGQTVYWYIGEDDDAYGIEVRIKELTRPNKIQLEWGEGEQFTEVSWLIEPSNEGTSKLFIEESGFSGSDEEVTAAALDSTKGFNQLVIALKALLEHDARINIVADHA